MNEIWADIKGFEGFYQVSNFGRVKSLEMRNGCGTFPKERILTATDNGNGYLCVHLQLNNKRSPRYVHRLVAEAFCEKAPGCNVINHLDYDKKNNVWTNLQWCTQGDNVRYSAERMRHPRPWTKAKTGEKGIYKRKGRYRIVVNKKEYPSRPTLEEAIAYRNAIIAGEMA